MEKEGGRRFVKEELCFTNEEREDYVAGAGLSHAENTAGLRKYQKSRSHIYLLVVLACYAS